MARRNHVARTVKGQSAVTVPCNPPSADAEGVKVLNSPLVLAACMFGQLSDSNRYGASLSTALHSTSPQRVGVG